MTPDVGFFSTYEKVDYENVTLDNDDTFMVVGIGNVFIKMHNV